MIKNKMQEGENQSTDSKRPINWSEWVILPHLTETTPHNALGSVVVPRKTKEEDNAASKEVDK
jgi:hypothetical protein